MGILAKVVDLIRELNLPAGFSVCELGDQYLTQGVEGRVLAAQFYKGIGAKRYVSIDGNDRATITADLNVPMEKWAAQIGQFDLVTDFGTGEHIFDQAEVWKTVHKLTKKDGYIAFDRPSQGYLGHAFYCIDWNLITAIAHANWYEVLQLQEGEGTRGTLIRGILKKRVDRPFIIPQQGRYFKDLVIDRNFTRRGAEYKSLELREAGVVGRDNRLMKKKPRAE